MEAVALASYALAWPDSYVALDAQGGVIAWNNRGLLVSSRKSSPWLQNQCSNFMRRSSLQLVTVLAIRRPLTEWRSIMEETVAEQQLLFFFAAVFHGVAVDGWHGAGSWSSLSPFCTNQRSIPTMFDDGSRKSCNVTYASAATIYTTRISSLWYWLRLPACSLLRPPRLCMRAAAS